LIDPKNILRFLPTFAKLKDSIPINGRRWLCNKLPFVHIAFKFHLLLQILVKQSDC